MNTTLVLKNIAKHILLTDAESEAFISLLQQKEPLKKTILLAEGEFCNTISYVHSGALRAYCTGKDGKEATIMFAVADWWITDMHCFLNCKPAMMQIEAIENSTILQMQKKDFDRLLVQIPAFEKFFRVLMQNAYTREQLRIIENLTLSAEERYDRLLIKYPHLIKKVTQKQIASYLGITPEFLSIIRRKKTRK